MLGSVNQENNTWLTEEPIVITFLDQWNPQLSNTDYYTKYPYSQREEYLSFFSRSRNTLLAKTQRKTDFGLSNSNVLSLQHNPYS